MRNETETHHGYRGFEILLDQGFYKEWFVRRYATPGKITRNGTTPRCFLFKHYKTVGRAKRAIDMHLRNK